MHRVHLTYTLQGRDDAQRDLLWPELIVRYPMFAQYQAVTARRIPMVRLVPQPDSTRQ